MINKETGRPLPLTAFSEFLSRESILENQLRIIEDKVSSTDTRGELTCRMGMRHLRTTPTLPAADYTNQALESFCPRCERPGHNLRNCVYFANDSIQTRWNLVTSRKLCAACLEVGHYYQNCPENINCAYCRRDTHCHLLHSTNAYGRRTVGSDIESVRSEVTRNSEPRTKHPFHLCEAPLERDAGGGRKEKTHG